MKRLNNFFTILLIFTLLLNCFVDARNKVKFKNKEKETIELMKNTLLAIEKAKNFAEKHNFTGIEKLAVEFTSGFLEDIEKDSDCYIKFIKQEGKAIGVETIEITNSLHQALNLERISMKTNAIEMAKVSDFSKNLEKKITNFFQTNCIKNFRFTQVSKHKTFWKKFVSSIKLITISAGAVGIAGLSYTYFGKVTDEEKTVVYGFATFVNISNFVVNGIEECIKLVSGINKEDKDNKIRHDSALDLERIKNDMYENKQNENIINLYGQGVLVSDDSSKTKLGENSVVKFVLKKDFDILSNDFKELKSKVETLEMKLNIETAEKIDKIEIAISDHMKQIISTMKDVINNEEKVKFILDQLLKLKQNSLTDSCENILDKIKKTEK